MYRTRSTASRYPASRRPRVLRASVGAVLVVLTALVVLGPVLGLVGAAAATGPLVRVPYGGIVLALVLGFVACVACLVGAWRTSTAWLGWTLVVLGWLVALVVSVWPLVATADAAVDSARDIWPWILQLVRDVRG